MTLPRNLSGGSRGRLNPYPAMKDSGRQWLGKVPAHWEVSTLRRKLRPIDGIKIGPFGSQLKLEHMTPSGYKVYGQANVISRDFAHGTKFIDQTKFGELSACQVLPGDLLVTMMGTTGRCVGVPHDAAVGIMDSHLLRLRTDASVNPRFASLLIDESSYVKEQIEVAGKGSIMHGLNSGIVKALVLALPSLAEQDRIVRFLDHADRRIRRYIRAKQKLITLLEEQKQAIIHQAVTGQIDVRTGKPYGVYKPAGVLGLPEVPKEWELCRLRNVVSVVTTGSRGWSSYASDTGPLFIRVANLSRGSLKLRFDDEVRLDLPGTSEAGRTRIKPRDLLVSVTAYIGSVGIAPEEFEEAYVSQHVARCQPLPEVCPRWLGYVLLSSVGQTHGQVSIYGGTKDGLSLDDVKNYPILLPPRNEQEAAVQWIEGELSALVKIGDSTRRELEMVREYRTRLIGYGNTAPASSPTWSPGSSTCGRRRHDSLTRSRNWSRSTRRMS